MCVIRLKSEPKQISFNEISCLSTEAEIIFYSILQDHSVEGELQLMLHKTY